MLASRLHSLLPEVREGDDEQEVGTSTNVLKQGLRNTHGQESEQFSIELANPESSADAEQSLEDMAGQSVGRLDADVETGDARIVSEPDDQPTSRYYNDGTKGRIRKENAGTHVRYGTKLDCIHSFYFLLLSLLFLLPRLITLVGNIKKE